MGKPHIFINAGVEVRVTQSLDMYCAKHFTVGQKLRLIQG